MFRCAQHDIVFQDKTLNLLVTRHSPLVTRHSSSAMFPHPRYNLGAIRRGGHQPEILLECGKRGWEVAKLALGQPEPAVGRPSTGLALQHGLEVRQRAAILPQNVAQLTGV